LLHSQRIYTNYAGKHKVQSHCPGTPATRHLG